MAGMDLRRLRAGEWIAAVAGVVLLAVLPLDWYEVEFTPGQIDVDQPLRYTGSAWNAFTVMDVLLALSAVTAIGLLVLVAVARTPSVGISAQALATLFCGGVAIAAVVRLLVIPGDVSLPAGAEGTVTRLPAAYVGVAASLVVVVGLVVAMRDERPSRPGRPTDGTGAPVPAPPEPERLPAPHA